MLVLTSIHLIVVVICSALFDVSMPFEEGYPAVVPEEPEHLPEAVIVGQETGENCDNETKTIKIDPTEEGFKKTGLDTCSSVEEARETVDDFPSIGQGIRPIQVGQGEPVQYGEAHARAEESTCQGAT